MAFQCMMVLMQIPTSAHTYTSCIRHTLKTMKYTLPAACKQVNYAVVTATEVAYFSYIYSVIPAEKYQRATGYLRAAMLSGYTFGATLGQLLISLAGTYSIMHS